MIILEREIPRIIPKLEALKDRLIPNHSQLVYIERDHASFMAGYQGEKNFEYYFSLLNGDKFEFYHGLRLYNGKSYFQIDTLIISKCYVLVVEIKNINGTVEYDKKNNQFTRKGKVLTNPLSQVKLQKLQIVDWFQSHKSPPFPVDFLVAMANNSTKINTPSGLPDHYWKICSGHDFLEKIQIYEKMYKIEQISSKERKRLKKLLLKCHTPLEVDVLKKYTISKKEVITGVQCPSCKAIPMIHEFATWTCPTCLHKSKNVHKKTIHDYFLIMGPTITNKQFRDFTHLESRQIASRLLGEMNLPHTGTNKGRIYYSPNYIPEENKKE